MENNEISIENRLKDLRKKHNLSQEELAEELGISRQSVIALEQGRYLPSLPLVINMCKFFHSPFEEIFEFQREIEEEIDNILNEDNQKININIANLDAEADHPSPRLRMAERSIMANEMEPWRPFREMVSLRDAMDRLFEDSVITPKGVTAMPKIDIKDKKDSIVVKAEIPGMAEEEVDVEISDGVMTISGEKKEEKEKEEEGYYYKESHSGSFSRSFTLPADVVAEKAEADMKDGVLSITIPKVETKKATKVKVAAKKK
ncbi:MAG: Hsp20 family protein [Patescibacteria group bacterium]|nr:Hsp20 family protein [Patescibacteria group bacterium]